MPRTFFTSRDGAAPHSPSALKWRVATGTTERVARAAYVDAETTDALAPYLAAALAANGVNTGRVAARLRKVDCPDPVAAEFIVPPNASGRRAGAKRLWLPDDRIHVVDGIKVVDGLQMLVDLASGLDDDLEWEQSLESTLFRRLTTIEAIEAALPELSRARTKGVARMRRVLALRPPGAPPTESLMETLMVQISRDVGAPIPTRQFVVFNQWGVFARPARPVHFDVHLWPWRRRLTPTPRP